MPPGSACPRGSERTAGHSGAATQNQQKTGCALWSSDRCVYIIITSAAHHILAAEQELCVVDSTVSAALFINEDTGSERLKASP